MKSVRKFADGIQGLVHPEIARGERNIPKYGMNQQELLYPMMNEFSEMQCTEKKPMLFIEPFASSHHLKVVLTALKRFLRLFQPG